MEGARLKQNLMSMPTGKARTRSKRNQTQGFSWPISFRDAQEFVMTFPPLPVTLNSSCFFTAHVFHAKSSATLLVQVVMYL